MIFIWTFIWTLITLLLQSKPLFLLLQILRWRSQLLYNFQILWLFIRRRFGQLKPFDIRLSPGWHRFTQGIKPLDFVQLTLRTLIWAFSQLGSLSELPTETLSVFVNFTLGFELLAFVLFLEKLLQLLLFGFILGYLRETLLLEFFLELLVVSFLFLFFFYWIVFLFFDCFFFNFVFESLFGFFFWLVSFELVLEINLTFEYLFFFCKFYFFITKLLCDSVFCDFVNLGSNWRLSMA